MPALAFGLHVEVRPGAVPECASTEVSTNIAFTAVRGDVRDVRMHFAFEGVPSNCIQVAFGRDADGDGILSFGETDAVYGWRNGRYFAEDVRAGVRTEETEAATGSPLSVQVGTNEVNRLRIHSDGWVEALPADAARAARAPYQGAAASGRLGR